MSDSGDPENLSADLCRILAEKDLDLDQATQLALAEKRILRGILKGVVSKDEVYRYNCFKVLLRISDSDPLVLYPEWDDFVDLMHSANAYHRSAAVQILANLATADSEGRFEEIFDPYFDLLDDESVIVARYLARCAGTIARAKPHLRERVAERLLAIDETHHDQNRKDLMKADVLQSFEQFLEESLDRERMLAFAEGQLACSSPKTRKTARSFLTKYGGKV